MRPRLLVLIIPLAFAGCSSGPKFVPVSGTVRLGGKPLTYAAVYFNPIAPAGKVDAPGPGSLGITDDQGRYTLVIAGTGGTAGAVVGEHRIRITTRGVGAGPGDDAPLQTERVPVNYNTDSDLRFTVPPGGTDAANFDLK